MLRVENLSIRYNKTNHEVISNLSFSINKGEIVSILGPSGCGKTSILNAIQGINQEAVTVEGSIEKAGSVNTVFQEPRLLPWRRLSGNVAFGLECKNVPGDARDRLVPVAIQLVGLEGSEKLFPYQLSLGMRQRANFARAIVCDPKILLLDEPFSSIDVKTKGTLMKEFLKIIQQKNETAIFVTHNIDEAVALSHRVIVLSKNPTKIIGDFENATSAKTKDKITKLMLA